MNDDIPESRCYRHRKCGHDTTVSGNAFQGNSNPLSTMVLTFCTHCNSYFPVSEYEWTDTGEAIVDYWARHSARATPMQRFLTSRRFMLTVSLVCAIALSVSVVLFLANRHLFDRILGGLAGLLVGAFVGLAIFATVFQNFITRQVVCVIDTRTLK